MIRWILAVATAALAGCSFEADFAGGNYSCNDGETCPDGYRCVAMKCVSEDAGAPADASTVDGSAVPDAGPDAAAVDFCEEAMTEPASDDCADGEAFDITGDARMPGGVTLYGDTRPQTNHLGTPATGCLASATPGSDAIYTLHPAVGETITARLTAQDFDSALYLLNGCTTGVACYAGDDELFTTPGSQAQEEIVHEVAVAETLYLLVDSSRLETALYAEGCYALEVTIE